MKDLGIKTDAPLSVLFFVMIVVMLSSALIYSEKFMEPSRITGSPTAAVVQKIPVRSAPPVVAPPVVENVTNHSKDI